MTKHDNLDSIIRKVKGLLATAEDNANENEAQAAFVLAQKIMYKYNIELSAVESVTEPTEVVEGQGTAYKTLKWYERLLAGIIATNFRVKYFLNSKYIKTHSNRRRAIVFYGLKHDVKAAQEIYVMANDALDFYTKQFVEAFYRVNSDITREKSYTSKLKNSYMQGFLIGLNTKLEVLRFQMQEEYGLVLLTPKVVEDSYNELSKSFASAPEMKVPDLEELMAYEAGYKDGEQIDYTKSTIDDEIANF